MTDSNREVIDALRGEGIAAVSGDAATPDVLIQAHIARAAALVITQADPMDASSMVATARALNPDIEIIVGARTAQEAQAYGQEQPGTVYSGDAELAHAMATHVVRHRVRAAEP